MTSRGQWYLRSWKGDIEKSGGLATNIGVHFFDMLTWLFGEVERNEVHVSTPTTCAGYLELEKARVPWFLSIDINHIPVEVRAKGQRTYRSITLDGEEIEFSGGFTDLHTLVYQRTLEGQGFGLEEAKTAIQIVHDIRVTEPVGITRAHPSLQGTDQTEIAEKHREIGLENPHHPRRATTVHQGRHRQPNHTKHAMVSKRSSSTPGSISTPTCRTFSSISWTSRAAPQPRHCSASAMAP